MSGIDHDESRGLALTERSLFNDLEDSCAQNTGSYDGDPQTRLYQGQIDRTSQLFCDIKAQKKQLLKKAAKEKARRDRHIAMMKTLQQH